MWEPADLSHIAKKITGKITNEKDSENGKTS
jgi:hypothetical protein